MACWGDSGEYMSQTSPSSSLQGVEPEYPFPRRRRRAAAPTTAPSKQTAPWHAGATQGDEQTSPSKSSLQGVNQNTRFLAVSAGNSHNCAIKIDGTMACWGRSADSAEPIRPLAFMASAGTPAFLPSAPEAPTPAPSKPMAPWHAGASEE